MNKEFIKGLKARERVVILKEIIRQDSLIIKTYKDSIVPEMQLTIEMTEQALDETYFELDEANQQKKTFMYTTIGLAVLVILQIIF